MSPIGVSSTFYALSTLLYRNRQGFAAGTRIQFNVTAGF